MVNHEEKRANKKLVLDKESFRKLGRDRAAEASGAVPTVAESVTCNTRGCQTTSVKGTCD